MKTGKRVLSIFLVALLLLTAAPLAGFVGLEIAPRAQALNATGSCGDNVTWSFNSSTGALTISGSGAMKNYTGTLYSPFYSKPEIKSVTVQSGVTRIGDYAFYNCTALTSVTIGNSVTSIGDHAFYWCTSLTSVTIPDSVTSIGDQAFEYCRSLTSVTIGNSVTNIGDYAFLRCSKLTAIEVGANNTTYSSMDGVLFNKAKTNLIQYPTGNPRTNYTIPNSVTRIGDLAFHSCASLTSVKIPNSVTSISNEAFEFCDSLTSVTIPDSVTRIGDYTFHGCDSLTSVTIPDSVTSISYAAFEYCTSLTSVTIPDSVTSIGDSAFYYCTSLTSVTIGDSVTSIGIGVFYNCDSLTSVTIPESLTSIGDSAFYSCDVLKDVFYTGTEAQWNEISIGIYNKWLLNATIHFSSEGTVTIWSQNFWVDGKHGVVDLQFNDNWFKKDSLEYEHELCRFCSKMAMLGYDQGDEGNLLSNGSRKQNELTSGLKHLGFDISTLTYNNNTGRDRENYFIVSKKIQVDNQTYDLVFAGFIGTYKDQWYTDFDPGKEAKIHRGFLNAKNYVYNKLFDYIEEHKYNYDTTKILLTGHSRGAAVANLLAAHLIDENKFAAAKNIYTYTFATPNTTTFLEDTQESRFKRIFNIVNPEDFVTKCMPAAWYYGRFGRTFTLPSKTNTSKYKSYLKKVKELYAQYREGEEYDPYEKGEEEVYDYVQQVVTAVPNVQEYYNPKFCLGSGKVSLFEYYYASLCKYMATGSNDALVVFGGGVFGDSLLRNTSLWLLNKAKNSDQLIDAHLAETYCAFLSSMTGDDLIRGEEYKDGGRGELGYYKHVINCPVDVEIYDKESNEIVGRITDNTVDEEVLAKENSIVVAVKGDEKTALLPFDGDYEVKLIGNDSGTMDCTLSEIDSNIGELSRVNFYDVPLEDGKAYTAETVSEDFVVSDHVLVAENGTVIAPNQVLDGDDLRTADVAIQIEGGGNASGDGAYTAGDYAELEAVPFEDGGFIGWYSGEDLVSNETQYRFRVDSDVTLTARFKQHEHVYESAITVEPTCSEPGEATYTCSICGDTYTEPIPATGEHVDEDNNGYCDACEEMMTGGQHCKYCGKIHGGLFGWLVKFFHSIFAIFKR